METIHSERYTRLTGGKKNKIVDKKGGEKESKIRFRI